MFILSLLIFILLNENMLVNVDHDTIQRTYKAVMKERNNLLHKNDNGKLIPKICCLCDRLIPWNNEKFVFYKKDLRHENVESHFLKEKFDWSKITKQHWENRCLNCEEEGCNHEICSEDKNDPRIKNNREKKLFETDAHLQTKKSLFKQYTAKPSKRMKKLEKYLLSPRSYTIKIRDKDDIKLGCCNECRKGISKMKTDNIEECKPPNYSIAAGCLHGYAPKCIKDLNDSELAVVCNARVNKHMITYTAGSHKSIVGWHSMNYSCVEKTNKVMNTLCEMLDSDADDNGNDNGNNEGTDDDCSTSDDEEEDDSVNDDSDSDNSVDCNSNDNRNDMETDDNINKESNKKSITIILAGPFTKKQHALTMKRSKIRPKYVNEALHWLKTYNIQYHNINISDYDTCTPVIIDESCVADTVNSNVEKVFEVSAVFPDPNEPTYNDGGCSSSKDLKKETISKLMKGQNLLISRPSKTILRDYEGQNLIKAFPLQFPYGVGGVDLDGEERKGITYYRYLRGMSNSDFHRAEFVTIIENMSERSNLINGAYCRMKNTELDDIYGITGVELQDGLKGYLNNERSSGPLNLFIRKMKAVTQCISHSEEAAKEARQKLFSMITYFGLPSILFTITPEDNFNYRIIIHSKTKEELDDYCGPPKKTDSDDVLADFVLDCKTIRCTYPGLCALDFENIIAMSVKYFLGWNEFKCKNVEEFGLFGDLEAWAYCVEEQGNYFAFLVHFN